MSLKKIAYEKQIEDATQPVLSSCSHENDTISRQVAIDAVHKNYDTILDFKSDGRTVADSFEDIINTLPPAQPEIDSEALIHTIEMGITATNSNDIYSLGMRNGMRWCKSLIDGVEPKFEDYVMMSVDDWKELSSVQPERKKGDWKVKIMGENYTAEEYREVLQAIYDMNAEKREKVFGVAHIIDDYIDDFSALELIEMYRAYVNIPRLANIGKLMTDEI